MLTTSFACLAVLGPALSRASPVATPGDQSAMEKRQDISEFSSYLPDCTKDPSYLPLGKSQDGSGTFVATSCTTGHDSSHCWTDYFVTSYQVGYSDWYNSGQVIDCSTTITCAEVSVNLNSSCTTDSTTWDNNFGVAIQAQLPLWFKDASISPSLTYDHSFGGSQDVQICTSTSDSGTCTWSDQKCHALWAAQRNVHVFGYMRRSCVSPRKGTTIPYSQPKRADGFYTVGLIDVEFDVPNNRIIGCSANCGDLTYPDPTPGSSPITTIK